MDGIAFFKMAPAAGPWPNAGRAVVAPKLVIEPTNRGVSGFSWLPHGISTGSYQWALSVAANYGLLWLHPGTAHSTLTRVGRPFAILSRTA